MTKKLTKHGNSVAVVIDQPILEMMGLEAGSEVDFSTDGKVLIMSPVDNPKRRRKFEAALEKIDKKYDKLFKRLAE